MPGPFVFRGASSPGPPYAVARGGPLPRSAPAVRFAALARSATATIVFVALLLFPARAGSQQQGFDLGAPREIAPGVTLYHLAEPSLLHPPAPVSIWLLRVNPGAADLRAVLSNDAVVDTEIVPDIAARHGALAA